MEKYLKEAVTAAKAAGAIQKENLDKCYKMEFKGPSDIVTEVDVACEKAIISHLEKKFPDHSFLGEEGGETRPGSDHLWIIDPLDGTTNFSHGYPRFCTSIGLSVEGELAVGVIYAPMTDELFTAVRGGGAFRNGEAIKVSDTAEAKHALACTGLSYQQGKELLPLLDIYLRVLPRVQSMRRDGCAALDFCMVATGNFDLFWELTLNAWDVAAGALLVEEAGGKWSGLDGKPIDVFSKQMLATNGVLHDEIVRIINEEEPMFGLDWVCE